jgi:DNA-binding HxlR family transcriptional regulator
MGRRTTFSEKSCPLARSMDAIGDWWSLVIVQETFEGPRRFGQYEKELGIAKNILADRLRKLIAHDILEIDNSFSGNAYKKYILTSRGRDLFRAVAALRQWAEDYLYHQGETFSRMVDARDGKAIRKIEIKAQDGRLLGPSEIRIKRVEVW